MLDLIIKFINKVMTADFFQWREEQKELETHFEHPPKSIRMLNPCIK